MARRVKRPKPVAPALAADPVLLSADLGSWAGPQVARAGHDCALLGKVEALRLDADGKAVEALRFPRRLPDPGGDGRRRGRRTGRIARGQGRIVTRAPVPSGTLLSGPGEWALTRDERIVLARAEEIQARRQRARKEKRKVRRLPARGGPLRFQVAGREPEAPYFVTRRGPDSDLASCTCPDFAKSELGTCKHIERVRTWFARQRKRLPTGIVSLWWKPREWETTVPDPLREVRLDAPADAGDLRLERYFDDEGWIREPPKGTARMTWVSRAIRASQRSAQRLGLTCDVDPAVERNIERGLGTVSMAERLGKLRIGDDLWQGISRNLGFKLHPYQEEGVLFLATRGRALLADDMGLGKTAQAIVAALLLRRLAGARKALVVCPASLKYQWRNEIEKVCGERAAVVEASPASRRDAYTDWKRGFLVINYELVLRDLEAIREAGAELVILDEAQRIKNWDTKTAKAVKRLESPFAFILTGTPLENRLTELHSLVEFLHPRALGPRWRLLPFHAVTEPGGRVMAYEGLDVLRSRLAGFFLRRERRAVLDQLPPRTDNTFWTEMTPSQWRPYRRHARTVAKLVATRQPLRSTEVRALLLALTSMRMLCNARAQYEWDRLPRSVREGAAPSRPDLRAIHSPKLEEFANVLEDLLDESEAKIVVFSQWERLLRLARLFVHDLLVRRGERSEVFHGSLDSRARETLLERFRSESDFRILFSTDAGGLGLNLQEAASVVMNLEVPWNPAVLEQRVGRVHRLGQRNSVRVLHFVTQGAIEERVRQVLQNKRALFEGLLDDETDRVVFDPSARASFVEQIRSLLEEESS